MEKRILWAVLGVGFMIAPAGCLSQSRAVLAVNEETITEAEFLRELCRREGARVLLELIDTILIRQAAAQQQISLTAPELELKVRQAIARVGSERDFEEELRRRRWSKEEFRARVETEALLERLALTAHPLDEYELRRYYDTHRGEFSHPEQVRLRLMLFREKANAEAIWAALRQPGADFAGLARAFSEDPATKEAGGDTGFISRSDLAQEITTRAFAMRPGEISDVFRIPDGWAIIKVEARRPAGVEPFEAVRETVRARAQVQHLEQAKRDWLRKARQEAQLEIPDPELAERVRALIEAEAPFAPSELVPELPLAPR